MKKLLLLFAVTLLFSANLHAQENSNNNPGANFGFKAGYSSLAIKASYQGTSASESASGFYAGAFVELYLSENFNLQPELTWARYTEDGEDVDVLLIPILLKYKPIEELGLLAGPQLDYLLNKDDSEGLYRLGLGMALGLSYDITDDVIIDSRYVFGLSNRLEDNQFMGSEITVVFNYFQVGLAYRF